MKTTALIKKDEEIFQDYGYDLEDSPNWYRKLYKKHQNSLQNAKKTEDHKGKYNLVLNMIPSSQ